MLRLLASIRRRPSLGVSSLETWPAPALNRGGPFFVDPKRGKSVDKSLDEFLEGVIGVVDATDYERLCLWEENRRLNKPRTWQENAAGLTRTVGKLDGRPVSLTMFTNQIDGYKILFIQVTGQVADRVMIRQWLAKILPSSAFYRGRPNHVDAINFHNVFRSVQG